MGKKFLREYLLEIEVDGSVISCQQPIRIQFNIMRNTLGSPNRADIKIYNLSQSNRALLFKDMLDVQKYIRVSLFAGYGSNLSLIFRGNVLEGYTQRLDVDFITTLFCNDGWWDYKNTISAISIDKNQNVNDVNSILASDLKFVEIGTLENLASDQPLRNFAYFGRTLDILYELNTGNQCFVDNEKLNILQPLSYLDVLSVDAGSGLLKSPIKKQSQIEFTCLMEAQAQLGYQIALNSIFPEYNGVYNLLSINHKGDAYYEDWTSHMILQAPNVIGAT